MQWFDSSQEQFVPQTPPIFFDDGIGSPCAVVPEDGEFSSSQDSQDSQEANVPGTPVSHSNISDTPHNLSHVPGWSNVQRTPINQSRNQNLIRTTPPVVLNRKSHYGTPLLEFVLLKSARKHAQDHQNSCLEQQKSPATPQLEQTVPTTPKQHLSVSTKQSPVSPRQQSLVSPRQQSPVSPRQQSLVSPKLSNTELHKTCENLDLFKGDEIFLK